MRVHSFIRQAPPNVGRRYEALPHVAWVRVGQRFFFPSAHVNLHGLVVVGPHLFAVFKKTANIFQSRHSQETERDACAASYLPRTEREVT